jgi:hypothetical protein
MHALSKKICENIFCKEVLIRKWGGGGGDVNFKKKIKFENNYPMSKVLLQASAKKEKKT